MNEDKRSARRGGRLELGLNDRIDSGRNDGGQIGVRGQRDQESDRHHGRLDAIPEQHPTNLEWRMTADQRSCDESGKCVTNECSQRSMSCGDVMSTQLQPVSLQTRWSEVPGRVNSDLYPRSGGFA